MIFLLLYIYQIKKKKNDLEEDVVLKIIKQKGIFWILLDIIRQIIFRKK